MRAYFNFEDNAVFKKQRSVLFELSFCQRIAGIASHLSRSVVALSIFAGFSCASIAPASAQSAPTVSAVSPNSGMVEGYTSVTLTGTNFTGVTAVYFGSTPALFFSFVSATSITATSPPGSIGVVDVTVTTAAGTSAVNASDRFTYLARPTLSSISPNSGPAAGGTSIAITGTNLNSATAVSFGSSPAASFVVNGSTSITAVSPAQTAGVVDVTVTTPAGTTATSSSDRFTFIPTPAVTSVSPNSGPEAGGTSVTLTGTNFTGATSVKFAGVAATSFTVTSATSVTAVAPAGSSVADITVTTPGGTSATTVSDRFTYIPRPSVSSISPSSGPAAGSTSVTISGANFTGATSVKFGGTAASSFAINSATSITAVSPAGSGVVDIAVTTPGGTSASVSADRFTFIAPPSISSVSPNAGPLTGGTSVVISGANFTGISAVHFGNSAATSFTVDSATSMRATAPAGASGSVDITVTTPGGTSATTSGDRFNYVVGPTIAGISPSGGSVVGGTSVTITGAQLTGATSVKFGNVAAASYSVTSATSMIAVSPPGTGTVDVTVTTPGGTSPVGASDLFVYVVAPVVTGVSPAGGPVAGGTIVTITGANFTGLTGVKFGSTPATSYHFNSATSITAVSPAHSSGALDIFVTTAQGGTSVATAADRFLYGEPDSVKARAVQNLVAPMVAMASGQAITGSLDNAIDQAFSSGAQPFTMGSNGVSFNFADEPTGSTGRIDDTFAAFGSKKQNRPMSPQLEKEWSLWLDIRGTGWKVNDNVSGFANDLTGSQVNMTGGLGRKISQDTLVGVFAGFENFKYDVASLGGGLRGNGETLGGYVARRFGDLRFDFKAGWSNVDYDVNAGRANGSFSASRWLMSSGINRNFKFGQLDFDPSASVFLLWEHQRDWVDSLGTSQPSRDFSVGRASVGSKLSQAFGLTDGWKAIPFIGFYGDFRFGSDNATSIAEAPAALSNGWSGRVTSGASFSNAQGISFSLTGELGGLGASYKVWSGQARASVPF